MIRHPRPMLEGHRVIIPGKPVRNVFSLASKGELWDKLADFINRYDLMRENILICNFGMRQTVPQVHFHVLNRNEFSLEQPQKKDVLWEDEHMVLTQNKNLYVPADCLSYSEVRRWIATCLPVMAPDEGSVIVYSGEVDQ